MKIIIPTKKEVFEAMRSDGCTWCGGCGCECTARINMKICFELAKNRMTKKEYTANELEEIKKQPCAADEAFDYFWEYISS